MSQPPPAESRTGDKGQEIGYVCQEKVVMTENIVMEDKEQCTHIYEEECFPVYNTVYKMEQVKECRTLMKKVCYTDYLERSDVRDVELCLARKERDCDEVGAMVCTTEPEMSK